MSLYGTRDVAVSIQKEVARLMKKHGLSRPNYNASLFHHPKTKVAVLAHGDDFVATGKRHEVNGFRKAIAGRFNVKNKSSGLDMT